MLINEKKTQLLCLSDNNSADVSSFIHTSSEKIVSKEEMKILGVIFNNKPTVNAHVQHLKCKFTKSLWVLIHLKRAKICQSELVKIYSAMLRPLLEYCAPLFHPMITSELSEMLESLQKRALRIIFGFNKDYVE